ncbi:10075_t:CDS:2, partial [Acaulospora colombiana]
VGSKSTFENVGKRFTYIDNQLRGATNHKSFFCAPALSSNLCFHFAKAKKSHKIGDFNVNVLVVDQRQVEAKLVVEVRKHWINTGRIDPTKPITMKELLDSRCVHGVKDGVKLLSEGSQHFSTPVTIEIARASRSAIKAIEKVGGNITCRYFNRLSLRATLKPEKFWKIPKFADPVKAKDK